MGAVYSYWSVGVVLACFDCKNNRLFVEWLQVVFPGERMAYMNILPCLQRQAPLLTLARLIFAHSNHPICGIYVLFAEPTSLQ